MPNPLLKINIIKYLQPLCCLNCSVILCLCCQLEKVPTSCGIGNTPQLDWEELWPVGSLFPFCNTWIQTQWSTSLLVALAISMKLISSSSPNTLFDLSLSKVHSETTVVSSSPPRECNSVCAMVVKSFQSSGARSLNSFMKPTKEKLLKCARVSGPW